MWIVSVRFDEGGYTLDFKTFEDAKIYYDEQENDSETKDVFLAEVRESK